MKEVVVISGKGGTGKTSITASLAVLGGRDIVAADCDVDAADMHLLLEPDTGSGNDFYSGYAALIDGGKCTGCGSCFDICRFKAIVPEGGVFRVNKLDCEGCGYCARICPAGAVSMAEQNVGKWFVSQTRTGASLVHAKLGIGAENSGKLVAMVKREAKRLAEETGKEIVLVDGSPGIGCPVVSSLSGADFVLLVTEPTVSGLHDLMRVHELVSKFRIDSGCIINKADLNPEVTGKIRNFLKQQGIIPVAELPYDEGFTGAMLAGKTIIEINNSPLAESVKAGWEIIKKELNK